MVTLEQAIANLQKLKENLTTIVGNDMVNHALDNIDKESYVGKKYKPRKAGTKRNKGRKLLVDSGDGRRSIQFKVKGKLVYLIAIDYMIAHNEGVTVTVSVRAHTRTRKGRTSNVKSHTMHMNLPQRQITGANSVQTDQINKVIGMLMIKACQ
jgi:hypothetical protein